MCLTSCVRAISFRCRASNANNFHISDRMRLYKALCRDTHVGTETDVQVSGKYGLELHCGRGGPRMAKENILQHRSKPDASHARQYKDREDNTARIATAVDNIVPRNYAAFALVLSRHFGFTQEQIADIITWTQELYNESLL